MRPEITAMVLCKDEEDYIEFCLNSIKDVVDHIVVCDGKSKDNTVKIIKTALKGYKYELFISSKDDYAAMRNECLSKIKTPYVLMIDGDEILANVDGTEVDKMKLRGLISLMEMNKIDSIDMFTRHFIYNYFTIDGRNNGLHFSLDRIYKIRTGLKYENKMHEILNWMSFPNGSVNKIKLGNKWNNLDVPIIWHFGHCKGIEKLRNKYYQGMKIAKDNDIPFKQELTAFSDVNEYCKNHELFRGTRPLIKYMGPLPRCMKLW